MSIFIGIKINTKCPITPILEISNKKLLRNFTTVVFGAEDRNRTGTNLTIRGILSPLRLPVPPPRQVHGTFI